MGSGQRGCRAITVIQASDKKIFGARDVGLAELLVTIRDTDIRKT
jgi:hypothetical protein